MAVWGERQIERSRQPGRHRPKTLPKRAAEGRGDGRTARQKTEAALSHGSRYRETGITPKRLRSSQTTTPLTEETPPPHVSMVPVWTLVGDAAGAPPTSTSPTGGRLAAHSGESGRANLCSQSLTAVCGSRPCAAATRLQPSKLSAPWQPAWQESAQMLLAEAAGDPDSAS